MVLILLFAKKRRPLLLGAFTRPGSAVSNSSALSMTRNSQSRVNRNGTGLRRPVLATVITLKGWLIWLLLSAYSIVTYPSLSCPPLSAAGTRMAHVPAHTSVPWTIHGPTSGAGVGGSGMGVVVGGMDGTYGGTPPMISPTPTRSPDPSVGSLPVSPSPDMAAVSPPLEEDVDITPRIIASISSSTDKDTIAISAQFIV